MVLGALSLAVSALENYDRCLKAAGDIKNYRQTVQLIRNHIFLQQEQLEKTLGRICSKNPTPAEIETRLQQAYPEKYTRFLEIISHMERLIKKLLHKLRIDGAGEPIQPKGVAWEWQKVRVIFGRRSRKQLLDELQSLNDALRVCFESFETPLGPGALDRELEASKAKFSARNCKYTRDCVQRIHQAASNALKCACRPHRGNLCLPWHTQEPVRPEELRVVLSTTSLGNEGSLKQTWHEVFFEVVSVARDSHPVEELATAPKTASSISRGPNPVLKLARALTTSGGASKNTSPAQTSAMSFTTISASSSASSSPRPVQEPHKATTTIGGASPTPRLVPKLATASAAPVSTSQCTCSASRVSTAATTPVDSYRSPHFVKRPETGSTISMHPLPLAEWPAPPATWPQFRQMFYHRIHETSGNAGMMNTPAHVTTTTGADPDFPFRPVECLCRFLQKETSGEYITLSSDEETVRVERGRPPYTTLQSSSLHETIFSVGNGKSPYRAGPIAISRKERLGIAAAAAWAVLHLAESPWLPRTWNKGDLHIVTGKDAGAQFYPSISSLLGSSLQGVSAAPGNSLQTEQTLSDDRSAPTFRDSYLIRNKTVFELGILLTELCLNVPFEKLLQDGVAQGETYFDVVESGVEKVYLEGGDLYGYAVQRCLRFEFPGSDLKKRFGFHQFRRDFFDYVVAPVQIIYERS